MANSPSGESVMERFLKILEAFDSRHCSLTISSIARRSGLPVTTTYRLATEMLKLGVLERSPNGAVQIGVRMWELGYRSSETLRLREAALPFMHDVQNAVRQHTNLTVLDDGEVLYIEGLSAPNAVFSMAHIASRLPLHACSSGILFMAYASPAEQEAFLSRPHVRLTDQTAVDEADLRRRMASARQLGYVRVNDFIVRGSSGVAVPIFNEDGSVTAALSVIVPTEYEELGLIVPRLRAAAKGITHALAGREPKVGPARLTWRDIQKRSVQTAS